MVCENRSWAAPLYLTLIFINLIYLRSSVPSYIPDWQVCCDVWSFTLFFPFHNINRECPISLLSIVFLGAYHCKVPETKACEVSIYFFNLHTIQSILTLPVVINLTPSATGKLIITIHALPYCIDVKTGYQPLARFVCRLIGLKLLPKTVNFRMVLTSSDLPMLRLLIKRFGVNLIPLPYYFLQHKIHSSPLLRLCGL